MGTVPYIHRGDRMPRAEAGRIPQIPMERLWREAIMAWMCFFRKTDTREPITMPNTQ